MEIILPLCSDSYICTMNETFIKWTPEKTSLMSNLERCPLNAEDDTRSGMVFQPSSGCVDTE